MNGFGPLSVLLLYWIRFLGFRVQFILVQLPGCMHTVKELQQLIFIHFSYSQMNADHSHACASDAAKLWNAKNKIKLDFQKCATVVTL